MHLVCIYPYPGRGHIVKFGPMCNAATLLVCMHAFPRSSLDSLQVGMATRLIVFHAVLLRHSSSCAGLDFSSSQLSLPLSISGVALMVWSLVFFPIVQRCLGARACAVSGLASTVFLADGPGLHLLPRPGPHQRRWHCHCADSHPGAQGLCPAALLPHKHGAGCALVILTPRVFVVVQVCHAPG